MLFSSPVFLFLFLPVALIGYYLLGRQLKNSWLLLVSLVFFAWGGVSYTVILLASIVVNYLFGIAISKHRQTKKGTWYLYFGVSINLLTLVVFKYSDFIVINLNKFLSVLNVSNTVSFAEPHILLPIGISFYTFHSLSYLLDIYKGNSVAQKNIFNFALYICMFSQLVAGPIIRYSDIVKQLTERTHSLIKFSHGVERFIIGLGKKVLLANVFAKVADQVFLSDSIELSAPNAWLGIICYTLQIYCDFSGYSDMAIGLGRMFGFRFLENFNFPYMANSIGEFWRRWHISLSSFFRDYVYIPLGGSRVKSSRAYLNLFIVFFLTGFWHGAGWSFIVWGLLHFAFISIERLGFGKLLDKIGSPVANAYTLLVIMFTWILFRADSLNLAFNYWKALFHFHSTDEQLNLFLQLIDKELYFAMAIAIPGVFGFYNVLFDVVKKYLKRPFFRFNFIRYSYHVCAASLYVITFVLCSVYLISGTYNPFIYFRF